MIRIHFRVIHVIIEKIIIGNTQPTHDDLGTSPEGPLKILTSGTDRKSSGDSQEPIQKLIIYEKIVFQSLQEEQLFKSSKRGRPRDVWGTHLRDDPGTK